MADPTPAAPLTTRLQALLEACTSGVGDEAVSEARSLGPELAGDIVASFVEAELARPTADGTAIRAAHLARELGLARAVPALVRCVELLPDPHPLRHAALAAVSRLGTAALDALLASFDRCGTIEARARIAEALSRTPIEDDRIRGALVRMLEDDPVNGARHLADRGEWRAVEDLAWAVDRLALMPVGDCALCAGEHLGAIASAMRVLGGSLSEEQRTKIDDVLERGEALWTPFEDPSTALGALRAPATRDPRPGRNAPCPCGSGKKYKKCHLEADQRDARH
jgi:hypothetical protein